jgi:hypothetical protein
MKRGAVKRDEQLLGRHSPHGRKDVYHGLVLPQVPGKLRVTNATRAPIGAMLEGGEEHTDKIISETIDEPQKGA